MHVHTLRSALGADRIVTRAPGYLLRVEDGELDAEHFERARADGKPVEALALWRGPALADVAFEPFAQAEAARLEERRLAALEARIDADLDTGRHAEVAAELEALVAEHPHRERLRAQQMLALYRAGRQADALAAYRDARAPSTSSGSSRLRSSARSSSASSARTPSSTRLLRPRHPGWTAFPPRRRPSSAAPRARGGFGAPGAP